MTQTLLELFDGLPARDRLEAWWNAPIGSLAADGRPSVSLPGFAVWLARRAHRPVLALVPDPEGAFREAGAWFRDDVRTVVSPAVETLPCGRFGPGEETVRGRLEANDALGRVKPVVCFTSWAAMTRPMLAPDALTRWSFTPTPGETYSVDDLLHRLITLGYRREPLVQARGEFSLRGGILDIFPPDRRRPLRAEFFGDELESLREFEVESQGSVGSIATARILPAVELVLTGESIAAADAALRQLDFSNTLPEVRDQWLGDIERVRSGAYFDGIEGFQAYLDPAQPTLLHHLPPDALIVSMDGKRSVTLAEQREQELQELVGVEIDRGELPQGLRSGLIAIRSLRDGVQAWRRLEIAMGADISAIDLRFEPVDAYAGRIDAFSDRVRTDARAKARVLIVTQQEPRLRELLEDRDVHPAGGGLLWSQTPLSPGLVVLGNQPVAQGFRLPSQQLEVYGDTDLFGGLRQRVRRGVVRARSATWELEFEPGDLIVHVDHGIGRFTGMRLMGEDGQEREYMH